MTILNDNDIKKQTKQGGKERLEDIPTRETEPKQWFWTCVVPSSEKKFKNCLSFLKFKTQISPLEVIHPTEWKTKDKLLSWKVPYKEHRVEERGGRKGKKRRKDVVTN